MATREESKARRRRAIVRAARCLMQETGQPGFSMRALAEQAGVSIATPYNLFGSKQAVMYAVLDADLAEFREHLEGIKADELEVFFQAVSLAAAHYAAEPGFYRAVLFAAYNDGGTEFRAMFSGPRHGMWRRMVSNAIAAGVLDEAVEANSFAANLGHVFFSCLLEWVNGLLTLEEMEARVKYGFALSLRGMAVGSSRDRLREHLIQTQAQLKALYKQRPGTALKRAARECVPLKAVTAANGSR